MVRVLLTGADGQLGSDIRARVGYYLDIELDSRNREALDVTDVSSVRSVFGDVNPDIVIHAAAFTAVDDCESNEDHAYRVNATGTKNVVDAASAIGARVLYVSTDYVFDGTKSGPYVETDEPSPASVYGRSKLAGEEAVLAMGDDGLVVRTSWVCGAFGSNMVKTILRVAETHETLTFVDDQVGKPTFTTDLAAALLGLCRRQDSGVMHVTNEGAVSWYEFCREVMSTSGRNPDRVKPCATHELTPPRPAPRPANSVLANTRFEGLGLPLLRDFRRPLTEVILALTQS